jgi:hypothetical protein
MGHFYISLVILCFGLASCKVKKADIGEEVSGLKAISGTEGMPLFDANDVSIMFPMDLIQNSSELNLKNFVTPSDFVDVIQGGQGKPAGNEINFGEAGNINNWKIVALRYDPCAPGAHAAAVIAAAVNAPNKEVICQAQLRLIAQPFTNGLDEDMTLHVLFKLSKDQASMLEQLKGLAKIKSLSNTDGMPLSVHPGLASGNPAVKAALFSYLTVQARPDRVLSIAVMGLAGSQEPWVFYATIRGPDGRMTVTPIPTVDDSAGSPLKFQALSFIGSERVVGIPSERATFSFPGLPGLKRESIRERSTKMILDHGSFDDVNILPLGDENLSLLHSIDNPVQNHFFTMDCVSCHTNSNLLFRRLANPGTPAEEKRRIEGKNALRFPVPKGVTAFVNFKDAPTQASIQRPWSVRNFGYFKQRPTIAMRTATETAEVVHDINTVLLGKSQSGPNKAGALSDAEYQDVEPKLWSCLQFSDLGFDRCLANSRNSLVNNDCQSPIDLKLDRSLSVINEVFIISHGAKSTSEFSGNLLNLNDKDFVKPLAHIDLGGIPLSNKFDTRHSDTDKSNIQLGFSSDFQNVVGFRYNMTFRRFEQAFISMKWDCKVRKWKGSISYGKAGETPIKEVATLEPRAFLN